MFDLLEALKVTQQCLLRLVANNGERSTIRYGKKSYTFDSGPVYGDNDKYIKTKIKVFDGNVNKIFKAKWCQKKKHHVRFDSDFARSCC